jgi:hypothetical protein
MKSPTFRIILYTVIGAVVGGQAFKSLLGVDNQYACTRKLLETTSAVDQFAQAQHFKDPCLNALGMMANGYDPALLFVVGALVVGVIGFFIGRSRSGKLAE